MAKQNPLAMTGCTIVLGQIGEVEGIAGDAVRQASQVNLHLYRLGNVKVLVWWGLEDNRDLTVHIGL